MPGTEPTWEAVSWILLGFTAWLLFLLASGMRYQRIRNLSSLAIINSAIWLLAYVPLGSVGAYEIWRLGSWSTELKTLLPFIISIVVSLFGHIVFHWQTIRYGKVFYPLVNWGIFIIFLSLIPAVLAAVFGWLVDMTGGILLALYAFLILVDLIVLIFYRRQLRRRTATMTAATTPQQMPYQTSPQYSTESTPLQPSPPTLPPRQQEEAMETLGGGPEEMDTPSPPVASQMRNEYVPAASAATLPYANAKINHRNTMGAFDDVRVQ